MSMYIRFQMMESNDGKLERKTLRSWESERYETVVKGETRTVQSHKDQTDINHIVSRYDRTGTLPDPRSNPQYGDVSDLNRPLDQLITESRDNLDTAGKAFEDTQKAAKEEADKKAKQDAEELAAYRAVAEQLKLKDQQMQKQPE